MGVYIITACTSEGKRLLFLSFLLTSSAFVFMAGGPYRDTCLCEQQLLLLTKTLATMRGRLADIGLLVDSEIVLSTRYGKVRVFMTLSTETVY